MVCFWVRAGGRSSAPGRYPIFQAASAAQRSTYGHGDGLEAWWTQADTRHRPRDGTGRGYQRLFEVPLAMWLKAGMLVPGETVNVYVGPGEESPLLNSSARRGSVYIGPGDDSPLLISSPQRGRAFLGTVESHSYTRNASRPE